MKTSLKNKKNNIKFLKNISILSYLNFSYDNLMKHLYDISITYCMCNERKCGTSDNMSIW